ncbi:6533_t:CDS:1, partial [Dentiscutata heterogama]
PGVYTTWDECKKQIDGYSGALYKKFFSKQQAEEFIEIIDPHSILNVWTDGCCNNFKTVNSKKSYLGSLNSAAGIGVFFADDDLCNLSERLPGSQQTNNCAELYAVIRALEVTASHLDLLINTDSTYVIQSYNVYSPKANCDLVNQMNKLIQTRTGKTHFNWVKGHSGIYENDQADRLAYLGSQKPYVQSAPVYISKKTIDTYFPRVEKKSDNSANATDLYIEEFIRILQILEQDQDEQKLVITTKNKNIFLMLTENRIERWLQNDWFSADKRQKKRQKLKAPKDICLRINAHIMGRKNMI